MARPELAAWAALQPRAPSLWSLRQYSDCFLSLGLELRVPEDISAAYKSWIVDGWTRLLRTVDLRSLPRDHRLAVVAEAERWAPTVAALDSGALRMYRFHVLAGPVRTRLGVGGRVRTLARPRHTRVVDSPGLPPYVLGLPIEARKRKDIMS